MLHLPLAACDPSSSELYIIKWSLSHRAGKSLPQQRRTIKGTRLEKKMLQVKHELLEVVDESLTTLVCH